MMNSDKTDVVRWNPAKARSLDVMDRKILGELARDATQSFANLSENVGLSAPAVHERVKRLRAANVIRGTVGLLDGPAIGKGLLAFIHVEATGWAKTKEMMQLRDIPEVEEIHSSTGDVCMILKVRVASSEALEGLLSRIYDVPEVRGTKTFIALSTHLERTPQAEITQELEQGPHIK